MMQKLELVHNNGDSRTVHVRAGIHMQTWKKGRKILIIVWGDLAGEYALDIEKNALFNFGHGGGICRTPLGWYPKDAKEAWKLWYELTASGRSLDARSKLR